MHQEFASNEKQRDGLQAQVNIFSAPTLLMQADPRQVLTANDKACDLFGKKLQQIKGHRGGQVFDCLHSFTDDGCGKDKNCEDCKIKDAVVGTFVTGKSYKAVQSTLDIKKHKKTIPYVIQISTEKHGEYVLVTIDKYIENAFCSI